MDRHIEAFLARANPEEILVAKFSMETSSMVAQRFLDAREGDIDKALRLLTECSACKREHRITYYKTLEPEDILAVDLDVLRHFYPHGSLGYDKLNRPILYEHSGAIDINAVLHMTTLEKLQNFHFWNMEVALDRLLSERAAASVHPLTAVKVVAVNDLAQLTLSHCSPKMVDHLKTLIKIDNICYPETLGVMLVAHTPKMALGTYKILKGLIDKKTQRKIELLSASGTTARLLELVDSEQLPVSFGGTGPEPYVKKSHTDFVHLGGKGHFVYSILVPNHYTLSIDSYIRESNMELSVLVVGGDGSTEGPVPHKTAAKQLSTGGQGILHEIIFAQPNKAPSRKFVTVPAVATSRWLSVKWTNLERWSSRSLVYSLTIRHEHDEEKGGKAAIIGREVKVDAEGKDEAPITA